MKTRHTLRKNQDGLVSIMVTMILMIVITLIVIGFAQISRRNQRAVLDRQLSTQAFYAAESGINDVRNLMRTVGAPPNKTSCPNTGAYYSALNSTVDASTNTAYTCLLVDANPTQLQFNRVDSTTSTITKIKSADPVNPVSRLTFHWQPNPSVVNPLAGCPLGPSNAFSRATTWTCGYGVLRIDLVPTDVVFTSASSQADTMTTFVVPQSGGLGKSIAYAPVAGNAETLTNVGCDANNCELTITGLQGRSEYYARIMSIYQGVPLQIDGKDASGGTIRFEGAQVVIDSTGRAQDVLRRIQVHVSATGGSDRNQNPDSAVSSFGPLCKRFSATGGYFANDFAGIPGSITADPLAPAGRLCRP